MLLIILFIIGVYATSQDATEICEQLCAEQNSGPPVLADCTKCDFNVKPVASTCEQCKQILACSKCNEFHASVVTRRTRRRRALNVIEVQTDVEQKYHSMDGSKSRTIGAARPASSSKSAPPGNLLVGIIATAGVVLAVVLAIKRHRSKKISRVAPDPSSYDYASILVCAAVVAHTCEHCTSPPKLDVPFKCLTTCSPSQIQIGQKLTCSQCHPDRRFVPNSCQECLNAIACAKCSTFSLLPFANDSPTPAPTMLEPSPAPTPASTTFVRTITPASESPDAPTSTLSPMVVPTPSPTVAEWQVEKHEPSMLYVPPVPTPAATNAYLATSTPVSTTSNNEVHEDKAGSGEKEPTQASEKTIKNSSSSRNEKDELRYGEIAAFILGMIALMVTTVYAVRHRHHKTGPGFVPLMNEYGEYDDL